MEMKWAKPGAEWAQRVVGRPKPMAYRPLIVMVPKLSWQDCFLEPCGADTDSKRLVTWTFLNGWPCVDCPASHLSISASVLAKALTPLPYKRPHTLHGEN
jgi:hypothetical protein